MPRAKPAPRPDDPPEWIAHTFRFGCGAVFGVFLAALPPFAFGLRWYWFAAEAVVFAPLCGFLAMKYGDDFWHWLADNWFWLWGRSR